MESQRSVVSIFRQKLGAVVWGLCIAQPTPSWGAVALKVLPTVIRPESTARERFRREARLAAQIEHPAAVPVYATGSDHGYDYYAMALVRGVGWDQLMIEMALRRDGLAMAGHTASTVQQLVADMVRRTSGQAGHSRTALAPPTPPVDFHHDIAYQRAAAYWLQPCARSRRYHLAYHRDIKPANIMR